MPSRRPPSQRDPAYALHRLPGTVAQAVPGLKVKNAAPVQRRAVPDRRVDPGGTAPIYLEAIVTAGPASVASNLMPPGFRVPAATTLRAVYVNVGTAPTGSALTVLLKRSGTTVATVNVAASATSGSDTGLSVALAKGDLLTTDISAVGSTVAGSDVLVTVEAY